MAMLHEKDGRAKNHDDFLEKLSQEHIKSIDDTVKGIREFQKPENQNHYLLNIFQPAADSMYTAFTKQLDEKIGKDDTKKIDWTKDKKNIESALAYALKEHLKISRPEVVKTVEELGLSEEETLEHLIGMYDSIIGAGDNIANQQTGQKVSSIREIIDAIKDKKDITIGDIKGYMLQRRNSDSRHGVNWTTNRYFSHHLSKFDRHKLMKHAYHKIKDSDLYKLDDKAKFIKIGPQGYFNILSAVNHNDYSRFQHEDYGLKEKEPKMKKAA